MAFNVAFFEVHECFHIVVFRIIHMWVNDTIMCLHKKGYVYIFERKRDHKLFSINGPQDLLIFEVPLRPL